MVIYGRYADIYRRLYTTTRLTCRIKHTNTKYRQIPPNTAKYRQIPPNTAKYRQIPPNTAKYRQIPPNTAKYRQIPQNTAKYRQIPPNTAKYRQIPPNTADAVPTVITPLINKPFDGNGDFLIFTQKNLRTSSFH